MRMSKGRSNFWRFALASVFLCAVVTLIHTAFYLSAPRSVLDLEWYSVWVRAGLIAFELAWVALVVGGGTFLFMTLVQKIPRILAWSTGLILCWILLTFIFASWFFYIGTGDFIGVKAFVMWWRNLGQMGRVIAHIVPWLSILIPVISLVFASVLLVLLRRILQVETEKARLTSGGFFMLITLLFAASQFSSVSLVPDGRANNYNHAKWQANGPISYLAHSVAEIFWLTEVRKVPGWAEQFLERPRRESLSDYIERVDESTIKRQNVIVVLVESMRSDVLKALGGEQTVMPTVDQLAQKSIRFRKAYTQATHSNYADTVPFSSQYPLRSQTPYIYPDLYSYPKVLIYDILKELGWRTAIVSSQDERWGGLSNFLDTKGLDHYLHSATYDGPVSVPRVEGRLTDWMMGDRRSGSIEDRYTVREAINWIRGIEGDPFFLYMNLQSSHLPFDIPADFDAPFELPEDISGVSLEGSSMRVIGKGKGSMEEIGSALWIRYLNSLNYIDSLLSNLFAELEAHGKLGNTIIVILADTGFSFYEHNSWGYGEIPWEEVARVPLVIHAPGHEGRDDEGVAEMVDVAPTLLSLLGLPPYRGFQGEDLRAVKPEDRSPAFVLTQTPIADAMAVVWGSWKYIYAMDEKLPMLFDLSEDPDESTNLIEQRGALFYRMDTLLALWRLAQINYYQSPELHSREFPPRLVPGLTLEDLGRANREAQ